MALRDFSDEEMVILKQITLDWRNREGGNARKPEKLTGIPAETLGQVNDVYIARIPVGGLPALNENEGATGSSTTLEDDTPNSIVCDLYRIAASGFMVPVGLSKRVYNISTSEIAESWASVHRDKFGKWIAAVSTGGGSRILFEIIEADFDCCNSVKVIVIGGPCDGSPTTDDELYVWDEAECFLQYPEEEFEDLVGRRGFATKLYIDPLSGSATSTSSSTSSSSSSSTSTVDCPEAENCRWVIDQLCCGDPR
tara:strand:+ start:6410 stop:7168 length:759 start_codon:yes stop_codon:yes gene_type:complete